MAAECRGGGGGGKGGEPSDGRGKAGPRGGAAPITRISLWALVSETLAVVMRSCRRPSPSQRGRNTGSSKITRAAAYGPAHSRGGGTARDRRTQFQRQH